MDSPLLWIRVDPEMEYLAEIHFHQPVQMWVRATNLPYINIIFCWLATILFLCYHLHEIDTYYRRCC
jgi:hypothetical protein